MDIVQWFKDSRDYQTGVRIYAMLPKASKNILTRLQRGENPRNRATLLYELNKLKKSALNVSIPINSVENIQSTQPPIPPPDPIKKSLTQDNGKVTMAMLPDPILRKRFVQKNQAFYKRWELKHQLNGLAPRQEAEALELITEIMRLTKLIDQIWTEIDYYMAHKKLLPSSSKDYTLLSPMAKVRERQLLYSRKSKREKTVNNYLLKLKSTTDTKARANLQRKISEKQKVITQMDIDIKKLNELINASDS
jgi:hypothetical protein